MALRLSAMENQISPQIILRILAAILASGAPILEEPPAVHSQACNCLSLFSQHAESILGSPVGTQTPQGAPCRRGLITVIQATRHRPSIALPDVGPTCPDDRRSDASLVWHQVGYIMIRQQVGFGPRLSDHEIGLPGWCIHVAGVWSGPGQIVLGIVYCVLLGGHGDRGAALTHLYS